VLTVCVVFCDPLQDAFLVCSTALKLQFQESLDKELFLAYLTDWNSKQTLLLVTWPARKLSSNRWC
jgi:hypothetical protein